MTVHVFAGPTIGEREARGILDARYLPPAAQGDVYRSALARPAAIAVIDGYFARVPAVWHKELLWALHQGIPVFGGASMGALRAAELEPFGMEGVGEVYRAYRDGTIDADDEVAVVHGEAEDGYRVLSEALVNIRATLAAAAVAGVVAPVTAAALLAAARARFYPERSWPQLLADGRDRGARGVDLDALAAWLPSGRIDQKHRDAVALLRRLRAALDAGLAPRPAAFVFEETQNWERARADAGGVARGQHDDVPFSLIADELRLDGDAYLRAYKDALLRHLMLERARRTQVVVADDAVSERRAALLATLAAGAATRSASGILAATGEGAGAGVGLGDVLREHGLTEEELERLAREQATLRAVEAELSAQGMAHLPDELRTSGAYGSALRRARAKAALLASRGGSPPSLAELGLTEAQLLADFFARRGATVPPDPARYARRAGFGSADAFRRAVLLDHLHAQGA